MPIEALIHRTENDMQRTTRMFITGLAISAVVTLAVSTKRVTADPASACIGLPTYAQLSAALRASVAASGGPKNGGFELNMWATLVNRDGQVCAVTFTGNDRGDQWPGSRVISAQKANTANAFSLPKLALSTANLYSAVQPGGSLFGLQHSNPVDTAVAYGGPGHSGGSAQLYGTQADPLVGEFVGGVNVFGGGLALYNAQGRLIGAVGVSGDSSCADHNIAWRVRSALGLAHVPAGVNPAHGDDGIVYDVGASGSAGGFGHPKCGGTEATVASSIGAGS
jgi:uncharacterized protein GlcG (DUF336 family)